jgi:hypothetical protein
VQCEGWLAFGKTEHQTKHKLAALHLSVKCWRKMSGQLVHIELTACINIKFHSHCQIERCSDIFVCGNEKKTHLAKNKLQCDGWLAFRTEHQTKLKLAALH